jgi:hypothetical protein
VPTTAINLYVFDDEWSKLPRIGVDVQLRKGDRLTLYTDGVPEARCKKGELYGFARTRVLLSNTFSAESVAQAASDFGQEDDITVLTIEPISVNESPVPGIVDHSVNLATT